MDDANWASVMDMQVQRKSAVTDLAPVGVRWFRFLRSRDGKPSGQVICRAVFRTGDGAAVDCDDGGVVAQASADVGEEVASQVVQECLRGLSVHWAARSASG